MGAYKIVTHTADEVHVTLVMIEFSDLAAYKSWASGRTSVEEVVSDLGDEAFLGPEGSAEPTILCFRSGSRAVRIALAPEGKDLRADHLRDVADVILSRM